MNWYRHPYSESRFLLSVPYFRSHLTLISISSPAVHFVQRSGIVRAILVEGHPRNIPV